MQGRNIVVILTFSNDPRKKRFGPFLIAWLLYITLSLLKVGNVVL